jgi:rhodanese-related sulfurtransferase
MYYDADAALIVDARDPDDFRSGHILGAVNLPYYRLISEPGLMESLDARGRPVISYCGGRGCEVSLGVAEELCAAGYERVAVYVGGFPEWKAAGHPVGSSPTQEEEVRR